MRRRKALEKGDTPVKETMSKRGIIAFPSQQRSITCSPNFTKHPDCEVCKMTKITWARCKVKAWEKRRRDCICYSIWRRGRSYNSERGKRVKAEKETEETMFVQLKPFAVVMEEIDSKFFEPAGKRQLHARQRGTFKWWKVFASGTRCGPW